MSATTKKKIDNWNGKAHAQIRRLTLTLTHKSVAVAFLFGLPGGPVVEIQKALVTLVPAHLRTHMPESPRWTDCASDTGFAGCAVWNHFIHTSNNTTS